MRRRFGKPTHATLVIANKCYSSWSLRPWLLMKQLGIAVRRDRHSARPAGHEGEGRSKHSPAGKVPILIDGDVTVWESIAIMEYVGDAFGAGLAGGPRGPRDGALDRGGDACGLSGPALRLSDESRQEISRRRTAARRSPAMSRASARSCARRASASAPAGRSCSAPSLRRTPCMRRSSRASTPIPSPSTPRRAPMWMRSSRCRPSRNGARRRSKETWIVDADEVDEEPIENYRKAA